MNTKELINDTERPVKGQIIRNLMKEKGITAKQLASELKYSEAMVYKFYPKDNFETQLLERIADILGVPVTVFFDVKPTTENNNATGALTAAGNNNTISGNTIHGNINVTLPPEGYKKIISSDGTQTMVELTSAPVANTDRIQELEKLLTEKDLIISSQAGIMKIQADLLNKLQN